MSHDLLVVGAGAAGLAAGIFARRQAPDRRVVVVDGARAPGAKILVSGGGRCNVTNAVVGPADFNGGSPHAIRQVLRAWTSADTVEFFARLGVPLHEEPHGKLFPDSNRARDVLDALLGEARRLGVELRPACRVTAIEVRGDGFLVDMPGGAVDARRVILATGGQSLPKTGSDGAGYAFATRLGHSCVPTTPALVPLVLDPGAPLQFHAEVSGVSHTVRLTVDAAGRTPVRVDGSLLWTHFGISGPAALDASRHWLRLELDGQAPSLSAALTAEHAFDALERRWLDLARDQPRTLLARALATMVPASVAAAALARLEIDGRLALGALTRESRRRLVHHLIAWPLAVTGSRGYAFAEVTAGGVPLAEVDPRTMASRRCPGLFLAGEILDVDGRLGGFNFQWAWSTARVAGGAAAAQLS